MSEDIRSVMRRATALPVLADPLPHVRARVAAARRRRLVAVAGLVTGAAAVGIVGTVLVAGPRTGEGGLVVVAADQGGSPTEGPTGVTGTTGRATSPGTPRPSDKAAPTGGPFVATDLDQDGSAAPSGVGRLVAAHPDVFVGSYVDTDGAVVAVLGRDADPAAWAEPLRGAAGGAGVRTRTCRVTTAELGRALDDLDSFAWPSGRPNYLAAISPQACAVVVRLEQLPAADAAALDQRFGDLVQVRTGQPVGRA